MTRWASGWKGLSRVGLPRPRSPGLRVVDCTTLP
ncbi:Uncharacterised protein [Bordetella pertussis]|nr:Uncharacterised protein [Bordetella pertussis]CFW32793.1 Uncharacterised protein [Bordetella pertussis]